MFTTSPSADPVLIVGAGPAGLTLGIELLRRGVACRVIDRAAHPATTSRAFTLHARTLELLHSAGIADHFVGRGIRSVSMDYRFRGVTDIARLDFTALEDDSRFPFTLVISQDTIETVLRERFAALGGVVEWSTELQPTIARDAAGAITVELVKGDGREETVRTSWLIGCDGLRSTVRSYLGADYLGGEYTGMEMRMMDVELRGFPLPDDRVHYLIDRDRLLLVTRLPGPWWRVLISDNGTGDNGATAPTATREGFQSVLDDHFDGAVEVGTPKWITTFRIWRRLSTSYGDSGIYLCGDAAHIHSPAGGQGMNACIQDAFNLGWKLAAVATGRAPITLLEFYERERRPIAEQLIAGTHLLHKVIMAHGTPLTERVAITREPDFNVRAVRQISGLAYTYRDVTTTPPGMPTPLGLAAGDRAPDAVLSRGRRVHDLLAHPDHTLLILQRTQSTATRHLIDALADDIDRQFRGLVRTTIVTAPATPPAEGPGAVAADTNEAHQLLGTPTGDGLCLIRPDGHLGLRCGLPHRAALLTHLDTTLTPTAAPTI
ncbi:FAD-dependent monooxygenase [Nocardia farcinica]|uniref:FAD-dependent monooxygenase n=1 Tax=Nocardia farcinica TaxID=37329 RepID=UPI001892ECE0|nr:FAD-dependent monooxygenase [Nocardia farcinica]MBF6422599.1 FAD-dependent monooxygenase [Nocardia farcinica]MBF6434245.1 FAD-dependent monooxygenase [Nocardia farcinica]MBF6505329.1 FAD-dependent monooxygenase [Nocardia farcinica]